MNDYNYYIDLVVEKENSPYQQLMRKTNHIDVDYFENISRDTEEMPKELSPQLKEKVLNDFNKMADRLFVGSDLLKQLMTEIEAKASVMMQDARTEFLDHLASGLENYSCSDWHVIKGPKYTEEELEEKFNKAKNVTLVESLFQNNKADVIDYHHALMERTWWEARAFVEKRTKEFFAQIAKSIRELA